MQLSVIIVNWNAGSLLVEAVSSISRHHQGLVATVIIVDNASIDDSLAQVEALMRLPYKLQIVRNQHNRGFGAACNQGAALTNSKYLLFLNPDTQLFSDSLTKSITFMQQPNNIGVGICGVNLVDEQGQHTTSAARFPTLKIMAIKSLCLHKVFPNLFPTHLMTSAELFESNYVDQVIGAFFLIRKNVFDLCNGFDERFFVYFEDVDLSLRVKKLGYKSYFLYEASAYHKGGGCSNRVRATRLFYSLRSRIHYAHMHYTRIEFIFLIILTVLEFPLRIIQGVINISWSDLKNSSSAYFQLTKYFIQKI